MEKVKFSAGLEIRKSYEHLVMLIVLLGSIYVFLGNESDPRYISNFLQLFEKT